MSRKMDMDDLFTGEDLEIDVAALKPLLEASAVLLLDVREPLEVAAGVIPGAMHIPVGKLPERFREIPGGRPVVVYCAHGIRSFHGAFFLRTQGCEDARSLKGGIVQWCSVGGALGPPSPETPAGEPKSGKDHA